MRKEDTSAQGKIVTEILQHLHACKKSVEVYYGLWTKKRYDGRGGLKSSKIAWHLREVVN